MTATELDDLQLVQSLRQLFLAARDARKSRQDNWQRNLRLLHNKLQTSGISSWQPQPKSSEIYPTVSAIVAWMMDNNISIDCIPSADPYGTYYQFISKLANDLAAVLYTNFVVEEYAKAIKLALWDAATYGIGIFKTIWDNELSGGLGNAVLTRVDPWKFFVDPYATSIHDMNYCVEVKRMTLDEIERRYPDARANLANASGMDTQFEEKPQLGGNSMTQTMMANPGQLPGSGTFGSLGSNIIGQFGQPHNRRDFVDADKTIFVYEFWLRENEVWYDEEEEKHVMSRWRVIAMAHGQILLDEYADDLWSYGGHPYDTVLFDDVGDFYGIALVDHLAQPQIYINRLLSMLQQNAELIGNPIFMESSNAGTSRVPIINRPGQRLTISGIAAMQNKPDWLRPPDMPPGILELVQYWGSRIENISGLSAITKGATPSQRNAEGVINSIQEAAFVRIRSTISNLESSLESAFSKIADLIIDNYDTKRIMAIVGPDGEKTAATIFANHWHLPSRNGDIPMEYLVQIRAGSSTPTSRQARISEADKLFAMGVIDDQAALEAHQYPHADEILMRLYTKRQQGLAGAGGPASRQRSQKR